jgi:hypothetical protein
MQAKGFSIALCLRAHVSFSNSFSSSRKPDTESATQAVKWTARQYANRSAWLAGHTRANNRLNLDADSSNPNPTSCHNPDNKAA